MGRVDDALRQFGEGRACSQAVLGAFAPSLGLDPGQAVCLSAGFAAGMRIGEVCGAATGAIIALGLARCDESCATREGRAAVASAVDEFSERFRQRVGAIDCPDIIGCDIRTPEGRASAQSAGLFASRCTPAVRAAAEILDDMLTGS